MDIARARAGGELAKAIDALQAKADSLQKAKDAGWVILNAQIGDPVSGDRADLLDGPAGAASSAAAINLALQAYQAQLDALNAQLEAL